MVVDLRDRGDARSRVLEGIPDFLRLRAAALYAQQPYDGRQAVLDAVAHLPRQHGLVVKGLAEIGVSMLALDGDAKQPGETGEEVRIGRVELPGFGTVDLKDSERQTTFAAARDQHVDGAPDPMIR
ncbi:hypothetical protein ABIB08_005562 [Bradyrhizobium sp. RT11b]